MLQGSLDNFALDEVLGLLSSTAKTGRLDLEGDRGSGSLTLRDGELVDATASGAGPVADPEDVVFELLRYGGGNFSFNAVPVPAEVDARAVDEVLAAAEARLAEFRTVAAVVPSLDHHLSAAEHLPADEITIGRAEWTALRAIGGGGPVAVVCDALGLNELDGCRQVKNLVERGLIEISPPRVQEPPPGAAAVEPLAPPPVTTSYPAPSVFDDGPSWTDDPDPFGHDALAGPTPVAATAQLDHADQIDHLDGVGRRGPVPLRGIPANAIPVRPFHGNDPAVDAGPGFDTQPGDGPLPAPHHPVVEDDDDDGRPGGLLMRYLRSDG